MSSQYTIEIFNELS